MNEPEMQRRFAAVPFAVLATHGTDGRLDLVPCCFAVFEQAGRLLVATAVDHKPKRDHRLARLSNVARDANVSFLADHRDDDWTRLWWVRVQGFAAVADDGPLYRAAIAGLVSKYPQYQQRRPDGPAIVVEPIRWQGWSAGGD